jgi:hypothetical protein
MTDSTPTTGEPPGVRALVVPADPSHPTRVVHLSQDHVDADLNRLVEGTFEVQAHPEGDLWLNNEGRITDLPINARASYWMLNDSTHARHGHVAESMVLYGDVVITGPPDRLGNTTDVNQHIIDYFQNLTLTLTLKDWDIRSADVTIMIFPTLKPGPDDLNLGL